MQQRLTLCFLSYDVHVVREASLTRPVCALLLRRNSQGLQGDPCSMKMLIAWNRARLSCVVKHSLSSSLLPWIYEASITS